MATSTAEQRALALTRRFPVKTGAAADAPSSRALVQHQVLVQAVEKLRERRAIAAAAGDNEAIAEIDRQWYGVLDEIRALEASFLDRE